LKAAPLLGLRTKRISCPTLSSALSFGSDPKGFL
jgi:hypothetical protein